MTDISKCTGRNCSQKTTCYRYLAETDKYRQAWVAPFLLEDFKDNECELYWEAKNKQTKDK
jgi:hypothetical protein